nr:hypothetical protein [uncultured Draconibacterium sp.]
MVYYADIEISQPLRIEMALELLMKRDFEFGFFLTSMIGRELIPGDNLQLDEDMLRTHSQFTQHQEKIVKFLNDNELNECRLESRKILTDSIKLNFKLIEHE